MTDENEHKLLVITRDDLHAGYQLVQSVHACADLAATQPQAFADWHRDSNSIITLAVPDEAALERLAAKLQDKFGAAVTEFREPDIENELTSISLVASPLVRRKLRYLPLALRGSKQRAIDQHEQAVTSTLILG